MNTPCSCCFTDTLAKCETGIKLNITLPVYGTYRWVITDKFGHKYQGVLAPDYIIPVDELPAGLLTQYAGEMILQIFEDGEQDCGPEKFYVTGKYDCISFTITSGTYQKNNLGCELITSEPLEYLAVLEQVDVGDPAANVIVNTLGVATTWSRVQEGEYSLAQAGLFTGDIWLKASPGVTIMQASENEIRISTAGDGVLNGHFVNIRKYN